MSDEPKDQRIPIMMSASEVKAIDDWSFENRIRTRAEAVRRLCQIGLMTSSAAKDIAHRSGDLSQLLYILDDAERLQSKEHLMELKHHILSLIQLNIGILSSTVIPTKSDDDLTVSISFLRQWLKGRIEISNSE